MSMSAPPPTLTRLCPAGQGAPGDGSPPAGRQIVPLPPIPALPDMAASWNATKTLPVALSIAVRGKSLYRFLLKPTGGFWRPGMIVRISTGDEKLLPKLSEEAPTMSSLTGVTMLPLRKLGPRVQATKTFPPFPIAGSEPELSLPVRQAGSAVRLVSSGWAITGPWYVLPPSVDLQTSICPNPPANWQVAGVVPGADMPMKFVTETTTTSALEAMASLS